MRHKGGRGQNERCLVEQISKKTKGIAVFTISGDRHGMNAAVRAFVRYEFSYEA